MFFPISNSHINPVYLVVVGFVIGILGGFFGVGGSFIAGPALRLMEWIGITRSERTWRTLLASRSSQQENIARLVMSI